MDKFPYVFFFHALVSKYHQLLKAARLQIHAIFHENLKMYNIVNLPKECNLHIINGTYNPRKLPLRVQNVQK
jgi:hypothetical protein